MLDTLQGALGASRNRRTSVSKLGCPQGETSYLLLSLLHFDDNNLSCILRTLLSFALLNCPYQMRNSVGTIRRQKYDMLLSAKSE